MTKFVVTSRHAEDVGLGNLKEPGEEFDDKEVLDAAKQRLKDMQDSGAITPKSEAGGS
jgi:hypothetical protein